MDQEKTVKVLIDGYPRYCAESKLDQVLDQIEKIKREYLEMEPPKGMTKEDFAKMVEKLYTVEIVRDED